MLIGNKNYINQLQTQQKYNKKAMSVMKIQNQKPKSAHKIIYSSQTNIKKSISHLTVNTSASKQNKKKSLSRTKIKKSHQIPLLFQAEQVGSKNKIILSQKFNKRNAELQFLSNTQKIPLKPMKIERKQQYINLRMSNLAEKGKKRELKSDQKTNSNLINPEQCCEEIKKTEAEIEIQRGLQFKNESFNELQNERIEMLKIYLNQDSQRLEKQRKIRDQHIISELILAQEALKNNRIKINSDAQQILYYKSELQEARKSLNLITQEDKREINMLRAALLKEKGERQALQIKTKSDQERLFLFEKKFGEKAKELEVQKENNDKLWKQISLLSQKLQQCKGYMLAVEEKAQKIILQNERVEKNVLKYIQKQENKYKSLMVEYGAEILDLKNRN